MQILYISGSPRKSSNTDALLRTCMDITGGKLVKLDDHEMNCCRSCWSCIKNNTCVIQDDFTKDIIPLLLECDGIVVGSPVYFNNVSAQTKIFIDRTWSIRGRLKDKVGGAIVVGRRYGAENALTAINSFFLKHEMIIANRGVSGIAYEQSEIAQDLEAMDAAQKLGNRLIDLYSNCSKSRA